MEMPEHFVDGHRLIVALPTEKPIPFEWRERNNWQQKLLKTGDFALQTHGELNRPRWFGRMKILAISLDPEFVSGVFQGSLPPSKISFLERRCESDPVISRFAVHFNEELHTSNNAGRLYGDSLAMAFSLHLIESYSRFENKIKTPNGKLSSRQLHRTLEFINSNIAENLSIEQLSGEACLSPFHFAKLFRNTIGLTPHQYVLQSRIERAKRLIIKLPSLNLTEIGLSVGFFDQAHFTKSFKRIVGATPKIFLRQAA
jgi:AraC family transcriptional regulator